MIIIDCDLTEFYNYIEINDMYCFGSGKYAEACCNILIEDNYCVKIKAFVDNNPEKWEKKFLLDNFERDIISPNKMIDVIDKNSSILICCADVEGVYEQLAKIEKLQNTKVFIWQLILSREYKNGKYFGEFKKINDMVIPKKIHYIWVGNKDMPESSKKYIQGWREKCPDYEIVEWNEKNYDFTKNTYMRQAYEMGYYGFVPDYARLDIIYNHGGIYLDTDVEIIKNLDELLYQDGFAGINMRRYMNLGGGFGAKPKLPIIKKMRDYYEDIFFEKDGIINLSACDLHQYQVLKKLGFKCNNKYQVVENLSIYPSSVLEGKNAYLNKYEISDNTFLIHHQNLSWFTEKMNDDMRRRNEFFEVFKKVF